ncbi:MAG: MopE-related protein [Pseudomonadota bacterium]|nr:MopE-related protein [Pseudomonadota bacterium]
MRHVPRLLLPVVLAACGPDVSLSKQVFDRDSDGYSSEVDCDDGHASVHPDADEVCDGLDNDCDGAVDDDVVDGGIFYPDTDGDGHGDGSADAVQACAAPERHVSDPTDCDDTSGDIHPDASEVCDGLDDDCDGDIDEEAVDAGTYAADLDGDGYGDPSLTVTACAAPTGYVAYASDCDDADPAIHPEADEADCADPTDYNCDGSVAWADADGDGAPACEDCDDTDPARNPEAVEVCDPDNVDEDCSGAADDADAGADPGSTATWTRDADGDGYGAEGGLTLERCDAPSGYSSIAGDCDDADSAINPGTTEVCDPANVDEDCDGAADDADASTSAASFTTWYRDADEDSYGDPTRSVTQCDAPSGYGADDNDCDDGAASISPAAPEVCNALDDDCDTLVDDDDPDVAGTSTWYADADGDGYGEAEVAVEACSAPASHVAEGTDCDDAETSVSPGAAEACDAADVDEDCDGLVDDADADVSGASTWYADADADGYGGDTTTSACEAPEGHTAVAGDCDDAAPTVNPAASERCDAVGADEDCDALSDDADPSATGQSAWYADADGDTYGAAATSLARCDAPVGYTSDATDCDDVDATTFPGGEDTCDDGMDQDCSGADETCPLVGIEGRWDVEIHGTTSNSRFGAALAGGDFNGDGVGDLLVGSPDDATYSATETGLGYGYQGPFVPGVQAATDNDAFAYYSGDYWTGGFGSDVWNLGDLNADGRDDMVLLAEQETGILVFYGGDAGTSGYASAYDERRSSCSNVTSVGNFAGTAYDDWACGDLGSPTTSAGEVHVYSGGSSREVAALEGETVADAAGRTVAAADDIDGDGTDDIWIGADGDDDGGSAAGAAYLVYGPLAGASSLAAADVKVLGGAAADRLGYGCSMPGDMDGDGTPDLLSAAPGADDGGADAGAVYLFTSVTSGAASAMASAVFLGEDAGDALGEGGLAIGDYDGDGEIDLAFGSAANDDGGTDAGAAWLIYGPFSGSYSVGSADVTWLGGYASDALGQALATVPDSNGDGRDELALGADRGDSDTLADYGVTWIWLGE